MITCVGIGPGDPEYLTVKASRLLKEADVVAGFDAVVDFVSPALSTTVDTVKMNYKDQVQSLEKLAERHKKGERVVIVFMGDIHFSGFQLLERVEDACGHQVETVAGISSAQLLASRARVCFDETTFLTFHRRGDIEPFKLHMLSAIRDGRNVIAIPRPWDFMPGDMAGYLLAESVAPNSAVEVFENLSTREGSWKGSLSDLVEVGPGFSDMSIVLFRTDRQYRWR